jgi:3-methyladenine DNA glycosylase AlkD
MTLQQIIKRLREAATPGDLEGMARVGITPDRAFGTKLPALRRLAREIGRDHALARQLWEAGYRETRILAAMVEEPERVTRRQMDRWARDFAYWELCDQCCMNLFYQLPAAPEQAAAWAGRRGEQQRRAGFALMAVLAVKDKAADDALFEGFFPQIEQGATDARGPVKKAVSWALRNIGKRNMRLNRRAVALARRIAAVDSGAAAWVARDVLRELTDEAQLARIRRRSTR